MLESCLSYFNCCFIYSNIRLSIPDHVTHRGDGKFKKAESLNLVSAKPSELREMTSEYRQWILGSWEEGGVFREDTRLADGESHGWRSRAACGHRQYLPLTPWKWSDSWRSRIWQTMMRQQEQEGPFQNGLMSHFCGCFKHSSALILHCNLNDKVAVQLTIQSFKINAK